ncbi:hypothetical protein GCM10027591_05500 [Zhihengliuella somnathii]
MDRKLAASGDVTLPPDTLSLLFTFIPVGERDWEAYGSWNFKNTYAGSGGTDDIAALHLSDECIYPQETSWRTWTSSGGQSLDRVYLKDAGINTNSVVFGIDDDVADGYGMLTDSGEVRAKVGVGCGPALWGGAFSFEHNHGIAGNLTVGVDFGVLNVSYEGPTVRLQKTTEPFWYDPYAPSEA